MSTSHVNTEESTVETRRGAVRMPAYMPVTTWGGEFPLDNIVRPFLNRLVPMVMVSAHYASGMPEDFGMPTFVDSGGFALLLEGAQAHERDDGLGEIVRRGEDLASTTTSPEEVLKLQLQKADFAATLDFPIPMSMTDQAERERRIRLTLSNAAWAHEQVAGKDVRLFGSVQGWDPESYVRCAQELKRIGFRDLAIGGLVQRISRLGELEAIVRGISALQEGGCLLHCFGIGEPRLVRRLVAAGATSTDSSSYVRSAISGKRWDGKAVPDWPSPLERAHAALANLAYAARAMRAELELDPDPPAEVTAEDIANAAPY